MYANESDEQKSLSNIESTELEVGVDIDDLMKQKQDISKAEVSIFDKRTMEKQVTKAYIKAKKMEIEQNLDLFERTLIFKKEVTLQVMALGVEKSVQELRSQFNALVQESGTKMTLNIAELLTKFGHDMSIILNAFREMEDIDPEIKEETLQDVRDVWRQYKKRIKDGLDSVIDDSQKRDDERRKKRGGW